MLLEEAQLIRISKPQRLFATWASESGNDLEPCRHLGHSNVRDLSLRLSGIGKLAPQIDAVAHRIAGDGGQPRTGDEGTILASTYQ
jgi:hypothetical protein